jgi:ribosome-binding factor A
MPVPRCPLPIACCLLPKKMYLCRLKLTAMNTTRQQKIEAMLQRELANIFLMDSRNIYKCMITVTKVTVTSDLSIARAYLSIYNTADKEVIINLIKENTKDIRYRLGQRVRNQLRVVPTLEFFLDDTLDYLERIDELLKK